MLFFPVVEKLVLQDNVVKCKGFLESLLRLAAQQATPEQLVKVQTAVCQLIVSVNRY